MDSKKGAEIKTIITSLLISNPMQSTIQQLCKDFYGMEGRSIPYQSLGFASIEDYLRSIPDVVHISGSGPWALVEGVITSKSEHINTMVLKQKKAKVQSYKRGFSRAGPRGNRKPPTFFYNSPKNWSPTYAPPIYHYTHNNTPLPPNLPTNVTPQLEPILKHDTKVETNPEIHLPDIQLDITKEVEPISEQLSLVKTSNLSPEAESFTSQDECQFSWQTCSVASGTQESTAACSAFDCDTESQSLIKPGVVIVAEADTGFDENVETLSEEDMFRVPLKVQNNLRQLIKQFPDGIECTKLPAEYRKLYKKRIHYEQYNYRSVIEMCSDLSNIFHYFQHSSDDYIVYDKDKPAPSIAQKKKTPTDRVQSETVSTKHILEELPKLDWSTSSALIPSDALHITDEIKRFFPDDLEVGDILDISIGEIYDLSKFWIYMTFGDLVPLMKNLQTFFFQNHRSYLIPELLLDEGLFCVSVFDSQYHRCVIINMLPKIPHCVRVLFIDYGTVENVSTASIWFLPKRFADVPCQAIRARLANICPLYENRPWTAKASVRFEQLITNRVVVAEVIKIDKQNHVLEVYLADITREKNIFYINDLLVKEKHAVYSDKERLKTFVDYECMPNVRHMHLYPEFYEIESGLAPTNEERKHIILNKIPLYHFMPQYFDISYYEDTNGIQMQHEKSNLKRNPETCPIVEPEDLDFFFFPDCLVDDIKELGENGNSKQSVIKKECSGETEANNSFKEYSCSKKYISELKSGAIIKSDKSETNSCCDSNSPTNLMSFKSISDLSNSLEQYHDIMPLNNSLQQLSLNNSDNVPSPRTPSNPFLTGTNPFRSTNPFVSDLEEAVNRSELHDLFAKPLDQNLPQRIVNNLNDSACSCKKTKQVNIDKSNNSGNLETAGDVSATSMTPMKAPESNDTSSTSEVCRRIRTPPGFSSGNLQNRTPFVPNTANIFNNYVPNSLSTNPYYQRFAYPQFNNNTFFPQNQYAVPMNQPGIGNYFNYMPEFYPSQYSYNVPNWPQNFPQQQYYPPYSRN